MSKLSIELKRIIDNSNEHMTAEELFIHCKEQGIKISLASVYRVLANLCEAEEIRKVSVAGSVDRYDKRLDDHGHLICTHCGKIEDVYIKEFKDFVEKQEGIQALSYDFNIHYICENCMKNMKKEIDNGKQV